MSTPPPPYTNSAPPNGIERRSVPRITILLLGSPNVGKSTFISTIPRVRNGRLVPLPSKNGLTRLETTTKSASTIGTLVSSSSVPNPTSFEVSLFARPYRIVIHRSTSTLFIDPFPDDISCVCFCYAIDDRASLYNVQKYWRRVYSERYETELGIEVPLMLLGLKRDLRTDEKVSSTVDRSNRQGGDEGEVGNDREEKKQQLGIVDDYVCIMPEHGVRVANEMRCDRYAECSSLTGELMWEALEDLTRMAAGTTTSTGGFSQGSDCSVM